MILLGHRRHRLPDAGADDHLLGGSSACFAWTVYDLNQIITGGETNYITATLSIYVNLFNIFSNLLSLLSPAATE